MPENDTPAATDAAPVEQHVAEVLPDLPNHPPRSANPHVYADLAPNPVSSLVVHSPAAALAEPEKAAEPEIHRFEFEAGDTVWPNRGLLPPFADGGIVPGPADGGSDAVPAFLEAGEDVLLAPTGAHAAPDTEDGEQPSQDPSPTTETPPAAGTASSASSSPAPKSGARSGSSSPSAAPAAAANSPQAPTPASRTAGSTGGSGTAASKTPNPAPAD